MSTTDNTTHMDRPLQTALTAARLAAEAADNAYTDCDCRPPTGESCVHWHAWEAAAAAVDASREALRDSDEPRDWILREEGEDYDTVEASSAAEALEEARSNVDRANYGDAQGTFWIDVEVRCEATGEEESCTVTCDEEEPECLEAAAHEWQSPHEIVGGIRENPGVWGHGGGVIIAEVCLHCGCERSTDTWAQRPDTGEQGLQSVRYEPGKHATWAAQRRTLDEVQDAGCQRAQRAAAEILAYCRDGYDLAEVSAEERDQERVNEVRGYLRCVRELTASSASETRALRLALLLAARDDDERRIARAVAARLF